MANDSNDRARMRNDLRELAKLAAAPSSSPVSHRFDTADSSGYVDLSAFSANDSAWVDRELAKAKAGGPPPPPPRSGPSSRGRAIDALSPESMAPVSLESFLAPDATASVRVSRGRRALYALLAAASVAGVAALALIVNRHAPPVEKPQVAAAAVAPPQETTPAAAPASPAAPASTDTPAAPPDTGATAAASGAATQPSTATKTPGTATGAKKKTPPATHARTGAAPAAAPAHAAAAPKPVVIPAAKTKGSGDSLMDAIRSSVAHGK